MQLFFIGLIGAGAAVVTGLLFGAALKLFGGRPSGTAVPAESQDEIPPKSSRSVAAFHNR
jgi:hypothetical protein